MADTPGEVILRRSGMPPLAFLGELLATAGAKPRAADKYDQWHELALYRTAAGRYVVSIRYLSTRPGESGRDEAMHAETAGDVLGWLKGYDPMSAVVGFPPQPQFAAKQRHLAETVCRRFDEAIAELYEKLDPAIFADRID